MLRVFRGAESSANSGGEQRRRLTNNRALLAGGSMPWDRLNIGVDHVSSVDLQDFDL